MPEYTLSDMLAVAQTCLSGGFVFGMFLCRWIYTKRGPFA